MCMCALSSAPYSETLLHTRGGKARLAMTTQPRGIAHSREEEEDDWKKEDAHLWCLGVLEQGNKKRKKNSLCSFPGGGRYGGGYGPDYSPPMEPTAGLKRQPPPPPLTTQLWKDPHLASASATSAC